MSHAAPSLLTSRGVRGRGRPYMSPTQPAAPASSPRRRRSTGTRFGNGGSGRLGAAGGSGPGATRATRAPKVSGSGASLTVRHTVSFFDTQPATGLLRRRRAVPSDDAPSSSTTRRVPSFRSPTSALLFSQPDRTRQPFLPLAKYSCRGAVATIRSSSGDRAAMNLNIGS